MELAMWEDAAINLAIKAVSRFFEAPKKDDFVVRSPGLAVGYYYNFLDLISQQLRVGVFDLQDETDPRASAAAGSASAPARSRSFDPNNITIQVILPMRLDGSAFQRCEEEFGRTEKGRIYLTMQRRVYGINYRPVMDDRLVIVDLARPVMALKRYYEEIAKIETDPDAGGEQWQKIQRAEIEAFRKTLEALQKRGYAELTNKLDFVIRG
jgi:Prokaryotic STING domain